MSPITLHRHVGYVLLVVVLALISLGIVMLFSTSGQFAAEGGNTMYRSLVRQGIWLGIGAVACVTLSRWDYHWFTQRAWLWLGLAAFLLLLCLIPHIGKSVNGSKRWISLFGLTMQPSEFSKWAIICFLAYWLGKQQRRIGRLWEGFGVPCLVAGGLMGLIVIEPDLGSCAVIGLILCVLIFCSGAKLRYLLPLPLLGLSSIFMIAMMMPERRARLLAFWDVEEHKSGKGYQVWQALIALGSGGTSGLGLGNSRQKMYYLPEAHTDFIFPIIGEELGMWIALSVVLAFVVLVLCSGWITLHAPDPTGVLLGTGITALLAVQATVNLAVVTSLIPNKGLPLPFISYGGSNLLLCLVCVGMLFNLQRHGIYENKAEDGVLLPHKSVRV